MGGEIGLEVLIPMACLLAILVVAVIFLACRYYLYDKVKTKKKSYSRGPFGSPTANGHPVLPSFKSVVQTVQMKAGDQRTYYRDLSSPYSHKKYSYARISDEEIYYDKLESPTRSRSDASEISMFSDDTVTSPTAKSERDYRVKKLKKQKTRFRSEPSLIQMDSGIEQSESPFLDVKRCRTSSSASGNRRPSSASAALSLVSPAGGQLEFVLFYDPEQKALNITINQLLDITLEPEIFLGILDVYDKTDKTPKTNRAYLKRNQNHVLELFNADQIGFFVYVTLLPKKTFRKYTNVVFGPGSIVFNEKLLLSGYTLEHLAPFFLCFHTLCKFGRDGEPIVLGEVKVPLKRIQTSQALPFMVNLGPPQEELELESALRTSTDLGYLELYLSFNPMAQKLIVKLIQATGLPKFGMTGKPNVSVKASLYFGNSRVSKRSTTIQKRSRQPVFNETFQFDLSRERLPECDILFEIRHHGSMYRTPIGFVTVGNSAGGEGTQHWMQLLDFSYHEKVHKIMPFKPVNLL